MQWLQYEDQHMDLKRWAHIVAVADRRSFVRAAEQVHLSQPALTRSIQAAEAELGMTLFDRNTQDVVPTPAGEFVVQRARLLLFNSHCLARDVALYRNRGLGDTAFGVGPFPAATFLSGLLAGVRREFPAINLRVEISNWELLLKRLREEDIEFFLADTRDIPTDPDLLMRPLQRVQGGFYVRAEHPLLAAGKHAPVTLERLWTFGVASVRLPAAVRTIIAGLLGLNDGADLSLGLECDDVGILMEVVLACDTVLAAPHSTVAEAVRSEALQPLNVIGLPPLSSETGVVTLRGRTPSPMAELIIGRLPVDDDVPPKAAGNRRTGG